MAYEIKGENIHMPNWVNDVEKLIIKLLREAQQKRLMGDPIVKKIKNLYKISQKNYKCPMCQTDGHYCLEAAHVGKPIMYGIRNIVAENWELTDGNIWKLLMMVIEYEKKYTIKICCKKCNKSLESNISQPPIQDILQPIVRPRRVAAERTNAAIKECLRTERKTMPLPIGHRRRPTKDRTNEVIKVTRSTERITMSLPIVRHRRTAADRTNAAIKACLRVQ